MRRSGVGKSSIIKAGLVPALKEKIIGERIPLAIVLSVYSDWVQVLEHHINQILINMEISISEDKSANLIEKIRLVSERNHTMIIVFDQFEEFFFNSDSPQDRIQFYRFFSECLNIPFVKIILSLREDYLHYLLEIERFGQDNNIYDLSVINKNILDKDIRYYLGKFSRQDAKNIIYHLTKVSYYEIKAELINQLVEDLAGTAEEVHPIELQIVGSQLQTENINTLEQYKASGGSKKLLERWLEDVIQDCGEENAAITWKLLFELTDEKGTRPLKTQGDLIKALRCNSIHAIESNWELILEILVGSGLVLEVREKLGNRYQLTHDYLVAPIRQKNNFGIAAEFKKIKIAKLRAEVAQRMSQEQLNLALQQRLKEARIVGVALAMMAGTIGALWWQADLQKKAAVQQTLRAEHSEINLKISAIAAASEALFASNKELDALMESLRAWKRLKQVNRVPADTQMRVVSALQQAVYGVTELNRLEGHLDIVWGIAFSPDGKLLASGSKRPDHKNLAS